MEKETVNKIKLGAFVTLGLILFVMGIYSIGNRQNLFSRNFHLNTSFKQVNGLQPGNNVRFSGINVGNVEEIMIINDSTILVTMAIKDQVREFIKTDAVATIGTDGLMGNMLVNIAPGSSLMTAVKDDGMIRSFEKVRTDDIINTLNSSNENMALLIEELLAITQGVNRGKGTIGALMKDSTIANNLRRTLHNINMVSEEAVKLTGQWNDMTAGWQSGDGLANKLFTDTTYANRLERSLENIEKSSRDLQNTTEAIAAMLHSTDGENVLNTVLRDSVFNAALYQTLIEVQGGSAKFNQNMEALQYSWPFKKYFRRIAKNKIE